MINNYPIVNIYEKKALKSKLSSQLIYGEKFKILSKKNGWLKIKTSYDKYTGFIKKRKFIKNMKVTHKISSLFANIYSKPKNKFILNFKLPFCSLISVTEKTKNFYKFQNYWIKKKTYSQSITNGRLSKISLINGVGKLIKELIVRH